MFYKITENDVIVAITTDVCPGAEAITEEEYETLKKEFNERGQAIVFYANAINSGEITMDNVPEEFQTDVSEILSTQAVALAMMSDVE